MSYLNPPSAARFGGTEPFTMADGRPYAADPDTRRFPGTALIHQLPRDDAQTALHVYANAIRQRLRIDKTTYILGTWNLGQVEAADIASSIFAYLMWGEFLTGRGVQWAGDIMSPYLALQVYQDYESGVFSSVPATSALASEFIGLWRAEMKQPVNLDVDDLEDIGHRDRLRIYARMATLLTAIYPADTELRTRWEDANAIIEENTGFYLQYAKIPTLDIDLIPESVSNFANTIKWIVIGGAALFVIVLATRSATNATPTRD